MEKKYPIGGYAPGDYWHKACKTCSKEFTGDKRAWNCEPCGEITAAAEKKFIEKFGYEDLFDYLSHNHGLNLLQSEMSDLIHFVHKFHPQQPLAATSANESDLQKVKEALNPRLSVQSRTGELYTVHKYILDNEGKQHIWCNDWYGHHVIGQDCEWESGQ